MKEDAKKKLLLAAGIIALCYAVITLAMDIYLMVSIGDPNGSVYQIISAVTGANEWYIVDAYGIAIKEVMIIMVVSLSIQFLLNLLAGIYLVKISTDKKFDLSKASNMLITLTILSFFLSGTVVFILLLITVLKKTERKNLLLDEKCGTISNSIESKENLTTAEKLVDDVKKIKELRDRGVISEEEFQALLKKILL